MTAHEKVNEPWRAKRNLHEGRDLIEMSGQQGAAARGIVCVLRISGGRRSNTDEICGRLPRYAVETFVSAKPPVTFGLDRLKRILPTGGTGTLTNYYRQDAGFIYAKTGSLSGVVALSGYLITKKNHLLLFSILINNYTGSGLTVRRKMEQWVHRVRDTY